MGVARSSFYADPGPKPGDAAIIEEIRAITDEFEGYGYRRVDGPGGFPGLICRAHAPPGPFLILLILREHV